MNRLGLGLAVGAGYVLGRTKKMKLAFAVGTMVAGKRMNLSPRALGDLLSQQLQNNPQFKEIGDQLREDMRGVGKAATGALVERQISGLADRLHGRTADVRDQLSGVKPDLPGRRGRDEEDAEDSYDEYDDDGDRDDRDDRDEQRGERARSSQRTAAKKASPKKAAAKKTTARKTAQKSPAKKAAKKAPARAAAKTTSRRGAKEGGRDE